MSKLTLGLVGSTFKENEKRVAIHPAHFERFGEAVRPHVFVERGYGKNFRISDEEIAPHVAGLLSREELFARCDAVMIFKPTAGDFPFYREGQVLWGACHNVQNPDMVQNGIDKRMTYIAMESMHEWSPDGRRGVWLFHTQSELAGYSSTLHALQLTGTKGWHDQPRRAAVISFGGAGRGAVHALRALEFVDITVYTMRSPLEVRNLIPTVKLGQYRRDPADPGRTQVVREDGEVAPFCEELAGHDIIVNCPLQDTDHPLMFVYEADLERFRRRTLIVDVSCDRGMGFEFARPTRFDDPLLEVGPGVIYYAVDHSPSLFYNTASLEHSKACWPQVQSIVAGRDGWARSRTVGAAVEIDQGVVVNEKILTFQNREVEYPHRRR